MNLGTGLYDLCVVGTFFLGYILWNKGAWREKPAFVAYIAFCAVRMLFLHPTFKSNDGNYAQLFWYFQLAALPFLGAAVGELFGKKSFGAVFGGWAALTAGSMMFAAKVAMVGGNGPAALTDALLSVDVIRYSGFTLAVLSLFAVRGVYGIASGLAVATMFSSIALMAHGPYRYASAAGFLVAIFLWIGGVAGERSLVPKVKDRVVNHVPHRISYRFVSH